MSKININRSDDPFYRYKMQSIMTVYERGHTVLINIMNISHDLNRPMEDILRFLKSKLSTSIIDKNDKIKIKGIVEKDKLQELIFDYIKIYVLCKECNNPETIITNNKLRCGACGNKSKIDQL